MPPAHAKKGPHISMADVPAAQLSIAENGSSLDGLRHASTDQPGPGGAKAKAVQMQAVRTTEKEAQKTTEDLDDFYENPSIINTHIINEMKEKHESEQNDLQLFLQREREQKCRRFHRLLEYVGGRHLKSPREVERPYRADGSSTHRKYPTQDAFSVKVRQQHQHLYSFRPAAL